MQEEQPMYDAQGVFMPQVDPADQKYSRLMYENLGMENAHLEQYTPYTAPVSHPNLPDLDPSQGYGPLG